MIAEILAKIITNMLNGRFGYEYLFTYPYCLVTVWSVVWTFFSKYDGGIGSLMRRMVSSIIIEIKLMKWRRENILKGG